MVKVPHVNILKDIPGAELIFRGEALMVQGVTAADMERNRKFTGPGSGFKHLAQTPTLADPG